MKHARMILASLAIVALLAGVGCERPGQGAGNGANRPSASTRPSPTPSQVSTAPAPVLLTDLRKAGRVDYLVIAGDEFVDAIAPLAEHRGRRGLAVGVARMSDVKTQFGDIGAMLVYAAQKWPKPAPKFLLLAGDTRQVPTVRKPARFNDPAMGGIYAARKIAGQQPRDDIATDFDYARPAGGKIAMHVGRLPARTPAELSAMVRKIIDYETVLPPGVWQRKVNFIASVGGFSPQVDGMLEDQFAQIVQSMPQQYDTEVAYSSTTSAFCPYPPQFNDNALEMLNRGCLFYVFIGHGSATQVDNIRWLGRQYGILRSSDAARMKVAAGLPVMIVLACDTGMLDRDDCFGAAMVRAPRGPVAFIGGSRITQPYANLLLADAMSRTLFNARTLGEALSAAKVDVLAHATSGLSLKADLVAAVMQGARNLPAMRMDVVEHYNLLGDPAMVLRRGEGGITLTLEGSRVRVDAPGRTTLTLELLGERMVRTPPQTMPAAVADAMERYHRANQYVLRNLTVTLDSDGRATADLPAPAGEQKCWVRASDGSSATAVEVPVKSSEKAAK